MRTILGIPLISYFQNLASGLDIVGRGTYSNEPFLIVAVKKAWRSKGNTTTDLRVVCPPFGRTSEYPHLVAYFLGAIRRLKRAANYVLRYQLLAARHDLNLILRF